MSKRGTIDMSPISMVYWIPADHLNSGACGSSLPRTFFSMPELTRMPPKAAPAAPAACAASAPQIENAPVVFVPGIGVVGRRPTPALMAFTKPFAAAALTPVTAQFEPSVMSLMITVSAPRRHVTGIDEELIAYHLGLE